MMSVFFLLLLARFAFSLEAISQGSSLKNQFNTDENRGELSAKFQQMHLNQNFNELHNQHSRTEETENRHREDIVHTHSKEPNLVFQVKQEQVQKEHGHIFNGALQSADHNVHGDPVELTAVDFDTDSDSLDAQYETHEDDLLHAPEVFYVMNGEVSSAHNPLPWCEWSPASSPLNLASFAQDAPQRNRRLKDAAILSQNAGHHTFRNVLLVSFCSLLVALFLLVVATVINRKLRTRSDFWRPMHIEMSQRHGGVTEETV